MASTEAALAIEAQYRARTPRSAALDDEARKLFPGGVTRSVAFFPPYPVYIAEGCGSRITDVDGHEYVDCLNNFGSMIHGHAHPAVVAAVRDQVGSGTDFGAPTELHLALARVLAKRLPTLERLRFTTSGTEAVLYAVRAARAFTGRSKILKFEGSYHGGYDSVSVSVDPGPNSPEPPAAHVASRGLPPEVAQHTLVARFNDLDDAAGILRAHRNEVAAVIVEPVTVRGMIPADADFLRGLCDLARKLEVLVILDEVVTFRLAYGGAQERFGLAPDLTTLGKIIGGGLPVGAFGGRADIMDAFAPGHARPVHHSGTFAGNSAVMAAGLATLEALTHDDIARVNALGDRFRERLGAALAANGTRAQVTGLGSLVGLHLTDGPVRDYRSATSDREVMRLLHLALLNRGIFARAGGGFFLSTTMGDGEIDAATTAVVNALNDVVRPHA